MEKAQSEDDIYDKSASKANLNIKRLFKEDSLNPEQEILVQGQVEEKDGDTPFDEELIYERFQGRLHHEEVKDCGFQLWGLGYVS